MENNFIQHFPQCDFEFPESVLYPPTCEFLSIDDARTSNSEKSSRGRKKLRPGNPLKTEVLDKLWFRLFTNFVKSNFQDIQALTNNSDYWTWYLADGKPGRRSKFLSYNLKYKQMLFENRSFSSMFAVWGSIYGTLITPNKTLKASWVHYYQYLFRELIPQAFENADQEEIKIYYVYICNSLMQDLAIEDQAITLNSTVELNNFF